MDRGTDGSFLARPSKGNPGDFTLSGMIIRFTDLIIGSKMIIRFIPQGTVDINLEQDRLAGPKISII